MWTYGQSGRVAVTCLALTVFACGDDSENPGFEGEQPDAAEPGAGNPDGGSSMDAGDRMDASRDATTGQVSDAALSDDAATMVLADGAVVPLDTDAAANSMDAATSSDAAARDARVGCDVTDSRYGCGTALSSNWLLFASGLEIDRRYERAWSPVFDVANKAALVAKCATLTLPGVGAGQFKVPAITDVRTLAGGNDNTLLTSNACAVKSGNVQLSEAGDCTGGAVGAGPNNGKYCKADVPECVTLWTQTACTVGFECPTPEVWLYNVATGAVDHTPEFGSTGDSALLMSAKGRCFASVAVPIP